jgi:hypothetical protein
MSLSSYDGAEKKVRAGRVDGRQLLVRVKGKREARMGGVDLCACVK